MVGRSILRLEWLAACCVQVPHRLGAGVTVWSVELPADFAVPERLLGAQEREQAARLRDPCERLRYMASYAVLRSLLAARYGYRDDRIEFVRDENGKPRLAEDHVRFNLSRSGAVVLIGVSESRQIGVDMERAREVPDLEALARNHLSATEYAVWRRRCTAAADLSFLRCWTRKEACVKAAGVGLALPLERVEAGCVASQSPREVALKHAGTAWTARVVSLPMPRPYLAAAAVIA